MAKTAKQIETEIKALTNRCGGKVAEWAKAYGERVVIQLEGCGQVRKGARVSIEADRTLRLPESHVVCDAYADEIAAIRAVLA